MPSSSEERSDEPDQHQELSESPPRPVSVPLDTALSYGVGAAWHERWTSNPGDGSDTE